MNNSMPQRPGLKRFKHLLSFKVIRIWLFIPQNIHTCIFFILVMPSIQNKDFIHHLSSPPTKKGMGGGGETTQTYKIYMNTKHAEVSET